MDSLKDKKAVITGGSRGIGKAIAGAYLKAGAKVFLLARSAEELAAVKEELGVYGEIHTAIADVSRAEDITRVAEEIKTTFGTVDILVNAAGVYGPIGPITEVDPVEWMKALEINLFGVFLAVHSFAPLMKASSGSSGAGGAIINFVGGGEGGYANFSSYVSAKGGIARFTETAAQELSDSHIRVNAIAPGAVNTKFMDDLIAAGPEKAGVANYEKALKQKDSGGVSPEEAAELSVFLASDASRELTGRIFSAVWDAYETLPAHAREIASSDVYTMRRIQPKDRGFDWGEKDKK
jgi:NAD(P)-dependent dehydrogenase (short-subunit alcohol dehydrogenase family)